MTSAPLSNAFERDDSRHIGVVRAVSPGSIDVTIFREAPHGTGLVDGAFHQFPRLNSYVVLPSERGSVLALVTWIGIDEDQPKAGPDSLSLPTPHRRLRAMPLGVLHRKAALSDPEGGLTLDRGVLAFPTVGDPVRLPTRAELVAVVPQLSHLGIELGVAPFASGAPVVVDPNRLFSRHLAVLGNTGSGKSCSVVGMLRAAAEVSADGCLRAIVLDMNGEYGGAFDRLGDHVRVRRLAVEPEGEEEQLRVPFWLWNYEEWLAFSDASGRSQAPLLRQALELLRTGDVSQPAGAAVGLIAGFRIVRAYAAAAVESKAHSDQLSGLENCLQACGTLIRGNHGDSSAIASLQVGLGGVLQSRRGSGEYRWKFSSLHLTQDECAQLIPLFESALAGLGFPMVGTLTRNPDAPAPFDAADLIALLPMLAAMSGPEVVGWTTPMVERLRILTSDERLRRIAGWRTDEALADWLERMLPESEAAAPAQITVIDLSLVPATVLHTVAAVLGRVVLEALERRRRLLPEAQSPTLFVVEEAHALVRRESGFPDDHFGASAARTCRQAFERIAREGRKFGLSLVVSSQRPSELSVTLLSQCNSFLVHRIVNDQDQALIRRLVPDNLGGLLDELPALPSRSAVLLGWAVDVPTLVEMRELAPEHRPNSADPDFRMAWSTASSTSNAWPRVSEEWAPAPPTPEASDYDDDDEEIAQRDAASSLNLDVGPEDDEPPF